MDAKALKKKENHVKLLLKGVDAATMNAFRRAAMKDVPVLAVEDVTIHENSSLLFDEFLAHRLGLLPVKTDTKTYKKKDKVRFTVNIEGPATVYSKDLKCTDPKIEIADKNIPVAKLQKGQKIKAEMVAVMGSGGEHGKWQPAVIGFQQMAEMEVSKDCTLCKKCVEACPTEAIEVKGKKIVFAEPYKCTLCQACVKECKPKALKIIPSEDAYLMEIETHGGLSAKELLEEGISSLKEKSNEFKKSLKDL